MHQGFKNYDTNDSVHCRTGKFHIINSDKVLRKLICFQLRGGDRISHSLGLGFRLAPVLLRNICEVMIVK
jgi:hypothetical protein